jgi:hypothetical protein
MQVRKKSVRDETFGDGDEFLFARCQRARHVSWTNHVGELRGLFKSRVGFCGERDRDRRNTHMPRTGRPRLKVKRSVPLKALVYPDDAEAFNAACEAAKVAPPDALRELARAWVKHVAENPRATLHFRLEQCE